MAKRKYVNRLNDLSNKEWIKFQKSWFVHNPPPRQADALAHPAKFPETLAQSFIEFFTKADQNVLDPMAGTGSTLVACMRSNRNGYGIELNPKYVAAAEQLISDARDSKGRGAAMVQMHAGDAADLSQFSLPDIHYVLTSPPYWNMLHAAGAETQRQRRQSDELDVVYSSSAADLGNIDDYDEFLDRLVAVYRQLEQVLVPRAYLTIIVKNIKKGGRIYPLAWDLARRLADFFTLKDERIWCQDNIRLAPYGMGNAWVSNTFHHYCLQFRHEP